MRKVLANKNTLALAQSQMILAYRETYLNLQRYLIHCLDWVGGDLEKKKKIKNCIEEVSQNYLRVKESLNF